MFETLFKRSSTGAVQFWQIQMEPQDNGWGAFLIKHGQVGGKPQESLEIIKEGKNLGKKNATTAQEQALKEAEARWTEKLERDRYGLTVEESDIKQQFAPMLAQSWTDKHGKLTNYAKKVDWNDKAHLHVQPKFDGNRCLAIHSAKGIQLFTREGTVVTSCDHLTEQLSRIMPPGSVLDGELYTHGVAVTKIRGYIAKKQEGTANLCFMMYDLLKTDAPFVDRLNYLNQLVNMAAPQSHLFLVRTQPIQSVDELMDFQGQCVENDYEGAMLRHGVSGYANGSRSASLLKVKTFVDDEFVVTGCREGRGKFEGAAIFSCVTKEGHPFECTAPGDMPTKQAYWANHQAYVGKKLTIKFQKMTETAQPVPFQPVAKGFVE